MKHKVEELLRQPGLIVSNRNRLKKAKQRWKGCLLQSKYGNLKIKIEIKP